LVVNPFNGFGIGGVEGSRQRFESNTDSLTVDFLGEGFEMKLREKKPARQVVSKRRRPSKDGGGKTYIP
jgi:hypothetical protein